MSFNPGGFTASSYLGRSQAAISRHKQVRLAVYWSKGPDNLGRASGDMLKPSVLACSGRIYIGKRKVRCPGWAHGTKSKDEGTLLDEGFLRWNSRITFRRVWSVERCRSECSADPPPLESKRATSQADALCCQPSCRSQDRASAEGCGQRDEIACVYLIALNRSAQHQQDGNGGTRHRHGRTSAARRYEGETEPFL